MISDLLYYMTLGSDSFSAARIETGGKFKKKEEMPPCSDSTISFIGYNYLIAEVAKT